MSEFDEELRKLAKTRPADVSAIGVARLVKHIEELELDAITRAEGGGGMKDYAKEAIHNVENTRLIRKALALAIQADANCTLTPEQCRTIVREIDLKEEVEG